MQNILKSIVGWLLVLSALGFYAYGIGKAVFLSWHFDDIGSVKHVYSEVLVTTVSSIQALLLTNLGIVLGISVARPASAMASQVLFKPSRSQSDDQAGLAMAQNPLELREKIQLFALVIFIIGLIACLITWAHDDFSTDKNSIVSVVSGSGQMFIGVVLAYLTAVFNKPAE